MLVLLHFLIKDFEILDLDPPNNPTSHYGACHFGYNLALNTKNNLQRYFENTKIAKKELKKSKRLKYILLSYSGYKPYWSTTYIREDKKLAI